MVKCQADGLSAGFSASIAPCEDALGKRIDDCLDHATAYTTKAVQKQSEILRVEAEDKAAAGAKNLKADLDSRCTALSDSLSDLDSLVKKMEPAVLRNEKSLSDMEKELGLASAKVKESA